MALLQRRVGNGSAAAGGSAGSTSEGAPKLRFVAKGLKAQRARLGLSAVDYARLVGVSPQSIYNWEQGHTSPRPAQVAIIAQLRSLGKREAQARLEQMDAKQAKRARGK